MLSIGLLASLLLVALAEPGASIATSADPPPNPAKERLELQKLGEEVEKLEGENEGEGFGDFIARFAPLITALVAVAGVIVAVFKQIGDQNTQRAKDREQREAEIRQRETENDRRLEDRFAAILTELAGEKAPSKASAAAAIVTYLEPRHARFHHQVRLAVLTDLKLEQEEPIRKLLARVYVEALRCGQEINAFERDLSRAKLANTDLAHLQLAEADLAFADLRDSNLSGCDLFRARGHKVVLDGARLCADRGKKPRLIEVRFKQASCRATDFSGALLVNAHMKEADLSGAKFYGCRLQAAHLEGADLSGARFEQADLADTYFTGATIDPVCAKSLSRAVRWRKAHFDPWVAEEIQLLAGE